MLQDINAPPGLANHAPASWSAAVLDRFFTRDRDLRGAEIDQYRLAGELKPGKNVILVKLIQNEQTEKWTVKWEFQMRVTDALGTPISSAKR